jgi:hypothetical protein
MLDPMSAMLEISTERCSVKSPCSWRASSRGIVWRTTGTHLKEYSGCDLSAVRDRYAALAGQPERAILLGTVLLVSVWFRAVAGVVSGPVLLNRCAFRYRLRPI